VIAVLLAVIAAMIVAQAIHNANAKSVRPQPAGSQARHPTSS
jgi:hypothetical protein